MDITKNIVNQKKFKITKSGTFTIDQKDILASSKFKKLVGSLKPVAQLNVKK